MSDSEENEQFGLFAEFLDEEGPSKATTSRGNQKATAHEILSMCKFIDKFEKWPYLNDDVKIKVIELLDYKTRFSLGICSRADNEVVSKTPQYVYSIDMIDNEKHNYQYSNEAFENVIVRVQFEKSFNSGNRFEKIFSQSGDDTLIRWSQFYPRKRPEKRQVVWENCNYYEAAVKYAESWAKKAQFNLGEITVEMKNYPFENSIIQRLPLCKKVRFSCNREEDMKWWLDKVPQQLNDLQLLTDFAERGVFTLSNEFVSNPQIMNVKQFYFWCRAEFSDEQLLQLKATKISFDAVNITDEGINEFLKMWVRGRCVENFQQMLLWASRDHEDSVITRGLKIRHWDAEFEDEAMGFCEDFGRCCGRGRSCLQVISEVDPYLSLTVSISSDRVSIYWTGKKMVWGGKTMTSYGIP